MRASDLTSQQARKLKDQVGARLKVFNALICRMDRRGWDPADPLYQAALHAQAAAHELHVRTHYAGVKHGVAKADEVGWPESIVRRA